MIGEHRSSRHSGFTSSAATICIVLSLGLLVAGLWPFRFRAANDVRWIGTSPGLRFERLGIVSGTEPLFGPGGVVDLSLPFTLRMEVRPRDEPSGSLPRILSVYDAEGRELFFLGQWRAGLVLRILEGERLYRLGYRETGAGGISKDATHSIVVRSENHALTLFVDGAPAKTRSGVDFSFLSGKPGPAWMILGNSPSGENPWRGDLISLSFYPVALSPSDFESRGITPVLHYGFSEGTGVICRGGADPRYDLVIPSLFRAPKKGILVPPWRVQKFDLSFWKDVLVNIFGFVPFGFAVSAWLKKNGLRKDGTAMGIVLLLGAGISLFIELLQVHLPTRDSSLTDFINNVLGTFIGARLFQASRGILYR